jgi:hypothetical protein
MHTKGHFLNIFRMHADLIVSTAKIDLGEESRHTKFIKQFMDNRYRKLVRDSLVVQGAVVNTKMPSAISLLNE